jgi:hypothetical protein
MSVNLNDTSKKANKSKLATTASELLTDINGNLPVFVRSPKFGTEYYSGLSRAKLYELAGKGHIRTHSLREPGQLKGTRLFHLQSILSYIGKCEARAGRKEVS